MPTLPTVIATSVVRSSHQGESHGGVYLVNLETGRHRRLVDWDHVDIDWSGRGGDRGLRGIAIHGEDVYIAASDELFVFDPKGCIQRSFRNPYLKHCHEICVDGDRILLTSTGFDSVLEFDIASGAFAAGWCIRLFQSPPPRPGAAPVTSLRLTRFDPASRHGPTPGDTIHLNHVCVRDGRVYISALRLDRLYRLEGDRPVEHAVIPTGTHNAQPFREGVLVNHTEANVVAFLNKRGRIVRRFPVPSFPTDRLVNADLPADHARPGFARGLCVIDDNTIVDGSSPSTICVHRIDAEKPLRVVNLTMDVRHAVHGLEVWPFDRP